MVVALQNQKNVNVKKIVNAKKVANVVAKIASVTKKNKNLKKFFKKAGELVYI